MDRRAVYVLKFQEDNEYLGLALDVHHHKNCIRFFDTDRGYEIRGKVEAKTEKSNVF